MIFAMRSILHRKAPKPTPLSPAKKAQLVAWARSQTRYEPLRHMSAEERNKQITAAWIITHYDPTHAAWRKRYTETRRSR